MFVCRFRPMFNYVVQPCSPWMNASMIFACICLYMFDWQSAMTCKGSRNRVLARSLSCPGGLALHSFRHALHINYKCLYVCRMFIFVIGTWAIYGLAGFLGCQMFCFAVARYPIAFVPSSSLLLILALPRIATTIRWVTSCNDYNLNMINTLWTKLLVIVSCTINIRDWFQRSHTPIFSLWSSISL